ncbi:tripartite tricarboxylate transporter TctB family protein [Telmatospirillum sp. J64-1]|uniref:tripartite tricarboxylate transporter TctB family protein n=1 Tax=Telmatospirillum sp. J64-1 TaxID=2502183 RepID=UPI00163DDEB5|nr:tripartite tricarboxylate transporter TctB family protein [Telmatospirillum sp. J64-1]
MTRLNTDLWVGVGVSLFAVALLVYVIPQAVVVPRSVRYIVLSPDFWPEILAYALLLLGVLMTLKGIFFTAPDGQAEGPSLFSAGSLRVLGIGGVFAGYYLLIPVLGMVWASVLAYGALAAIFRSRHRLAALLVAILLPLILYAFFTHIAGVPIPQGQYVRLP